MCDTATKSRSPPTCQCPRGAERWKGTVHAVTGAKIINEPGERCQSRTLLRAGLNRQKPWDHKQDHEKRKALWLYLCLANWGCDLQTVWFSYQLRRAAQLSQQAQPVLLSSGSPLPDSCSQMAQEQMAAVITEAVLPSVAAEQILSFPKPGATPWLLFP